jgi:hypothetical protein
MKVFSAFQLVCLFVVWPLLIQWLSGATFAGAGAAFYTAIAVYVVMFFVAVGVVAERME